MAETAPHSAVHNHSIRKLVCEPCWTHFFNFDAFQKALVTETNPESGKFSYNLPWEIIRASAAGGCNWCNLLSGPAKTATGEAIVTISFSTETAGYTPAGVKKLTLSYGSKDFSVAGEHSYRLYTTADDPAGQIIRPRDRILHVNTPSSFKLALGCLEQCMRTHHECPKHMESNLPDRVIDCSDLQCPKLVVTHNARGVYATLSYVWGLKQTYVATTENVASLIKDGIDMNKAPPTIKNAILSAHSLGVRYLWIDAFCILQDSPEDKGRQIGKMNEIYTHAYFTIIAACAETVDDGFLDDRPARIPAAHIPFICPDGELGSVLLASTEMVGYDVTQMYHDEMEPISSRGWCLQERILSERSFVFAADTLKYQCQKEIVSIGHALCEPTTGPRLPKAFSTDVSNLAPDEKLWTRRSWLYIIWEYSRRTLSHRDDDILNALGGIAQQYRHIWNTKYYAGLWEHTFLEDLLWGLTLAERGPLKRPGPQPYRSPSWSWAAVDGQVQIPNTESKLAPGAHDIGRCVLVQCEVTPAHKESLFSAVTAGLVKLETFLHTVTASSGIYSEKEARKLFLTVGLDGLQPGQCVGTLRPDTTESFDTDEFWIAPILWDQGGYKWVGALVIVAVENDRFRRVGLLRSEGDLRWVDNGEKRVITLV